MELQLEGKRGIVTGSSAGIGEAIAKELAGEGVIAAVHGRRPQEVARVVAEIEAGGGAAVAVVGDVTVAQDCDGVAEQVAAVLGGLNILVNNAGSYQPTTSSEIDPEQWSKTYEANVVSVVRLLKRFLPGMIEQRYGRLIQIASGEASNPFPTMPDYAASKAALVNARCRWRRRSTRPARPRTRSAPRSSSPPAWRRSSARRRRGVAGVTEG
jgi:3-oxoacyl-[acyl-carrier protein] reductase